jgi:putative phage-type endonuclease
MIVEHFEQGTDEWFSARLGRATASCFDQIITTKGEPSKSAQKYMYKLAGEAITGKAEESYTNAAMERGKVLEAEARALYEFHTGRTVQQVGIVYSDEKKLWSCSPDGLMEDRGLEIKCPSMATHVSYLLGKKLPTDYFQQVHGSMFVTGLNQWDFLSYYPGLPHLLVTVELDEKWCNQFFNELTSFVGKLEQVKREIMALGQ